MVFESLDYRGMFAFFLEGDVPIQLFRWTWCPWDKNPFLCVITSLCKFVVNIGMCSQQLKILHCLLILDHLANATYLYIHLHWGS
jgi:hypothetical protein